MTGPQLPLVLIPRFTGLVGSQDFSTVPLEVTPFLGANVTIWRGPLVGTSPTFLAFFEVSSDTETWIKVPLSAEGQAGYDPTPAGDTGALTIGVPLLRRWFRVRIELRGSSDPAVTCWCAGNLELRVN